MAMMLRKLRKHVNLRAASMSDSAPMPAMPDMTTEYHGTAMTTLPQDVQ